MTKRRNVLRLVLVIWLALVLRTGFVDWPDHENAVVQGEPTPTNPSGFVTENIEFRCSAPLRAAEAPVQVDPPRVLSGPTPPACSLRGQRQALFWVDLGFGVLAIAGTFAHLPRRWSLDERTAATA